MVKVIEIGGFQTVLLRHGELQQGECVPIEACSEIFRLPRAEIALPKCTVYWVPRSPPAIGDGALTDALNSPSTRLHEGLDGRWRKGQRAHASLVAYPFLSTREAVEMLEVPDGSINAAERKCADYLDQDRFRMHRHPAFGRGYIELFDEADAVTMKLALSGIAS